MSRLSPLLRRSATPTRASAIIKSSMIDYAIWSYNEERLKLSTKPISAWFCADISVLTG